MAALMDDTDRSAIVTDLLALPPIERRAIIAESSAHELRLILDDAEAVLGTWHGLWHDDPVGWTVDVLGEYVWSKQREVGRSVVTNRRTCVVASHSVGKSYTAGRLVSWWMTVHRPGTAQVVTTAPTFRQVRNVLWPHIHRIHRANDLPGRLNRTEWLIDEQPLAWGFSPRDEAGGQGVHAEFLLVVVDEAGGIPATLGRNLDSLMTGENTRIVAIGNPPTDEDGAWFETIAASPVWHTIRISAFDAPPQTGEACPPAIVRNLVGQEWIDDIAAQYGTDDPYYIARVLAEFPKSASRRVVPRQWAERVHVPPDDAASIDDDPTFPLSDWQRLGVDVAGGGGDEMVVALADGMRLSVADVWSGAQSVDQVVNAERVLQHILVAEAEQARRGFTDRPVRVKIDATGIGAGTADVLARMKRDKEHSADIVRVIAGEAATDAARFLNRRAEGWWTLRELVRDQTVRLVVDEAALKQITTPLYTDHQHGGRIAIETKAAMKKRGFASPDRADAVILSVYEPTPVGATRSTTRQTRASLPTRVGRRR